MIVGICFVLLNEARSAGVAGLQTKVGQSGMIHRAREQSVPTKLAFRFLDRRIAIIEPLRLNRSETHLGNFSYSGFARLKTGATIDQATADIRRMIPLAMERFPPFAGFTAKQFQEARLEPAVRSLKQSVIGDVATGQQTIFLAPS